MFLTCSVDSLLLNQYFRLCTLLGMRMRAAVICAVYKKSVMLSAASRKQYTTGEIVNLVSNDANQFVLLIPYLNVIWSGPFQIIVSIVLLWRQLGAPVVAGVVVMLLALPVNLMLASKMKRLQKEKMDTCDKRVKLISEVLVGIRVLKLYAWEPSFQQEVNKIREQELRLVKKSAYMNSFLVGFLQSVPILVALTTFATFVLTSKDNELTPTNTFVSLSLFNILRFPLAMFPMMISSLLNFFVALKRLTRFLSSSELCPDAVSREDTPGVAAVIERGVFAWDPQANPDQLSAIVGSVGAGKSSLISALLGEMERFGGRVNVKDSVAYVPQKPWIFNASLRDNILFHKPYKADRYRKVLEACALLPDLAQLPAGDQTEIGEKGINLSGGQKQRISLARACYADTSIYLLDDPLSAVDAHVGRHLMKEVIGRSGLLARKTRIMTTNSPMSLVHCDRVALLVDGRKRESGTYRQLLQTRNSKLAAFLMDSIKSESDSWRKDSGKRKSKQEQHSMLENTCSQGKRLYSLPDNAQASLAASVDDCTMLPEYQPQHRSSIDSPESVHSSHHDEPRSHPVTCPHNNSLPNPTCCPIHSHVSFRFGLPNSFWDSVPTKTIQIKIFFFNPIQHCCAHHHVHHHHHHHICMATTGHVDPLDEPLDLVKEVRYTHFIFPSEGGLSK
ncbi:Multidrug resistance-associated protein 1 [Cichlidogyrus casuarinus]|uniref:Multidrug resistance-associated protein 1 n=1 Tax=Cichlidogyrus casuarinus TaxID=1844966 RepID=A0ABD2Q3C1_9PLAT